MSTSIVAAFLLCFFVTDAVGGAAPKRGASKATRSLQVLSNNLNPLAEEFNAASDKVRFLAILSPT